MRYNDIRKTFRILSSEKTLIQPPPLLVREGRINFS